MKNKVKIMTLFLFGICSLFLMGATNVSASELVQEKVPNVYYTRRGNGKPYQSAQYTLYSMDGKVVYCIEPGTSITTNLYEGNEGWVNSPYSDEVNQKIQLIGYYGYEYPGHNTLRYRMATQSLIWETVGGQIHEWWTEASGFGDNINIDYEKGEIMKLVNAHYEVPSFNNESQTTVIGQEVTFTDSKGVLSNFEVVGNSNARIEGNNLIVKANTVGDITVRLQRKSYTNDPTTVFVGIDEKSQKMAYFGLNDPIVATVRLTSNGGTVSVKKLDKDNMSIVPRGDAKMTGTIYGIYKESGERVGQVTIGSDSTAKSDYLPSLGRFYLLEEKAGIGYKLDSTKYYFEITESDLNPSVTVYEKVIEAKVDMFKVYADSRTTILTAEPNITFEFYLKSNNQLYATGTTNKDGKLSVTLPFGTYVVKQKNTTEGYEKLADFVIKVENEETITKLLSNAEITAKLKLVKVDSNSKRMLVRDGIKFKIKNLDTGEYVCQNVTYPNQEKICVFETSGGVFVTPYVLGQGNYQIEELEDQVIDGYLWNSEPLKFSINENSKFFYDEEFGVMLEVQFENTEVKGEVEVRKYGEQVVKENGTYHYEEIELDGVTYELYADEDIYSGDGTLIYKAGELIDNYVTKDGYFKISNLYLGKYCLVESATVNGHKLDSTRHCFTLQYIDGYTPIVSLSFTFKNYLEKGSLDFSKKDLTTGKEIPNVRVEIYDAEDDTLIYSGVTNENGKITIDDLYVGKFYIVETEPETGYKLSDEKVLFEITEDGEVVKAEMTNEKITGNLVFKKVDEDGNALSGVTINLYDSEGNLIGTYVTDENGLVIVEGLEYGDYSIKECATIEGYELSDETLYFSIVEDGAEVNVSMVNTKLPQTDMNDYSKAIALSLIGLGSILFIVTYSRKKKSND